MLQVNFLQYLNKGHCSLMRKRRRKTFLHSCLCTSAFQQNSDCLCWRLCCRCVCFSDLVCACVYYTAEYQLPVIQPKTFRLPHCTFKPPITSESPLLSVKDNKDNSFYLQNNNWRGRCHILHSGSSMDEHVHRIMAGVNGAQQGQIEML